VGVKNHRINKNMFCASMEEVLMIRIRLLISKIKHEVFTLISTHANLVISNYIKGNNMIKKERNTVNFAFKPQVKNLMEMLSTKYGRSKTKIIEEAVEEYAVRKAKEQSKIMNFAGSIMASDADEMQKIILEDRINKKEGNL